MSYAGPTSYAELNVIKKNRPPVSIKGRTVSFEYFESLYSPMATANLTEIDSGGTSVDRRGQLGTLKDTLPITGLEDVSFIFENGSGQLNFASKQRSSHNAPFKVNGSPTVSQDHNRQLVLLPLISNYGMANQDIPIFNKYKGRISDSVTKILKDQLKVSKYNVEPTVNKDDFIGKGKSPFDLITGLCKKSIPSTNGDPGYFFYETQDGFNFRSIDSLIKQVPKEDYVYSGQLNANLDNDENNFKILSAPIISKDQNVLNALQSGTYSCRYISTNPYNFETREDVIKLTSKTNLGERQKRLDVTKFMRTYHHLLDINHLNFVSTDGPGMPDNDPGKWQAKSVMRYNLLHTVVVEIQVPCNLRLRAGDIIRCDIEKVTQGDKNLGWVNNHQSGKYLILHLCHHFDPERSYTSMTLVRDTYGLYTGSNTTTQTSILA